MIAFIFLGSGVSVWLQWPALTDPLRVQNDVRIHLWWMRVYQDGSLFPGDALADLMVSKSWRNPGYTVLMKGLSPFADPVSVSKWLGTLLLPLTLVLVIWASHSVGNTAGAASAGLIYLALAFRSSESGLVVLDGLQRSFRDAVFFICAAGLARRSVPILLVAGVSGLLFYPPTVPVISAAVLIMFGLQERTRSRDFKQLTLAVLLVVVLVVLVWAGYGYRDIPFYGYKGSIHENPRFGPEGREPVFAATSTVMGLPLYFLIGKSGGLLGVNLAQAMTLLCLLAAGFILTVAFDCRKPPPALTALLAAGLSLFVFSWAMAWVSGRFPVYFPSRYNTLQLFAILWLGWLAGGITRQDHPLRRTVAAVCLCAVPWIFLDFDRFPTFLTTLGLLAVAVTAGSLLKDRNMFMAVLIGTAILLPRLRAVERAPGTVTPAAWEKDVIEILKSGPPSTMIAGPPHLLDNISVHARRPVFVSFEMDTEMRDDRIRQRFVSFYEAYYSGSFAGVLEFCKRWGIDFMLVDLRDFKPDFLVSWKTGGRGVYLEPVNSMILEKIRDRDRFALANPPPERIVYRHGDLVLLNISTAYRTKGSR